MAVMEWGTRDKRGEWQPEVLPEPSPLFQWPLRLGRILKHFFGLQGFLWPINLFVAGLAVGVWYLFSPSLEQASTFAFGWIAGIYLRNVVILIVIAGGLHLRLYVRKRQGMKYKYTNKWLAANDKKFMFNNQTWDNIFWNLTSGAIVWTAWEAVSLWMYGNGIIPMISFRESPVYFVLLMIGVIYLRLFHFYWVHRFIHWKPMFKLCHYLHHKNINIGPWSGLTMHPIEHLLYFSGALFHWVIPSHPIHMIFHLLHAGATPAIGHTGFHKIVGKNSDSGINAPYYFHYLHHRYFTVNFGETDFPLDKWFGSHHNGSPEAHAAMMARRKARVPGPPETA